MHWQDEETISAIQQALNDQDSLVRLAAVQALAMVGAPQVIQPLFQTAEGDPEENIRAHALLAIEWVLQARSYEEESKTIFPAPGAVRTRGPHRKAEILVALDRIGNSDRSPYVRFLARGAYKRLARLA